MKMLNIIASEPPVRDIRRGEYGVVEVRGIRGIREIGGIRGIRGDTGCGCTFDRLENRRNLLKIV